MTPGKSGEFKTVEDDALAYDEDRCPHDGGVCHHHCEVDSDCLRESGGMALSEPCEGYPLPGHEMPDPPLSLDRLRYLSVWLNADDMDVVRLFHYDHREEIRRIVRALFEEFTSGLCLTCGGEDCQCPDPFPPGDVPR